MAPYAKVKFQVLVFGYRIKIDNSELGIVTSKQFHVSEKFRLIVLALYIKAITRISPEFSELSLWPDTQSFDKWSIPPRLEVLPLTQQYQTEQTDLNSKMPDRCLNVYSAQITSLPLNQVTLQPEFNLNNVTCKYPSICSIMFYYFGGDLRYE